MRQASSAAFSAKFLGSQMPPMAYEQPVQNFPISLDISNETYTVDSH